MFGGGKKFNPDTDIPDLTGKTILVTGGSVDWAVNTVGNSLNYCAR